MTWLIEAKAGTDIAITAYHERAGTIHTSINLG